MANMPFFILAVIFLRSVFKSRRQLLLENLALRQQVTMLRKSVKRPRATVADKLFWILFSRYVDGWRTVLHGLHPDTVVRWHRQSFRFYWRWKSRGPKPGRPAIDGGLRKLIREMQAINRGWGAPRIHGELLKLGIEISQATVSKYMVRQKEPPSQTWRTLLANHSECLAAIDFFTVPTAQWTAQQLVEAFPFESGPRYLLRDRDAICGDLVQRRINSPGIEEVITAPRSPWQNPFFERIIGSIRRDCLDHIIVLNERHLRRILRDYFNYYHTCRTHLSLNKDPPETRTVEPTESGKVVAFPRVGGLHHRYERIAA